MCFKPASCQLTGGFYLTLRQACQSKAQRKGVILWILMVPDNSIQAGEMHRRSLAQQTNSPPSERVFNVPTAGGPTG